MGFLSRNKADGVSLAKHTRRGGKSSTITRTMNEVTPVGAMSNRDFLEKYAAAGRVGLVCGSFRVDKLIRRAQRHVNENQEWGLWSHALVFQGERADGHH